MKNKKNKIKDITPQIDEGKYPVKWEIDIPFCVTASIDSDGKPCRLYLQYSKQSDNHWQSVEMHPIEKDKFKGEFIAEQVGTYFYTIEATLDINKIECDKFFTVYFQRPQTRFATWYEMWPRSQGKIEGKSATFKIWKQDYRK